MTDWETSIHIIRQAADDKPNSVDYPVSNLLTLVDNLMADAVSDELAKEIQEVSAVWLKKLFDEAST